MRKLMSANLRRLWKDKIFWLAFFFLTIWGVIQRIAIKTDTGGPQCLDETFWIVSLYIGIVLSIFISLFVGVEFDDGTFKNKIIMGHIRSEVYFANVTVCIIAGWLMCLGYLFSSLLVGIPLLGFFRTELSTVFLQGICVFALIAAYAAIYCMIAMTARSRVLTAIACLLLAFLLLIAGVSIFNQLGEEKFFYRPYRQLEQFEIADEQNSELIPNPKYLKGTERGIYETMFDVLPGGQSIQLSGVADISEHYMVMLLASLGWVILSSSCGVVIFRKSDLK